MMVIRLKRILQPVTQPVFASAALLLLRLIVGAAFVLHGWVKVQHPFEWMGPEAFAPGFFQFLAAITKFGGGIALLIGLLTPVAALGIGCTMTMAVFTHLVLMGDPFVNPMGGHSYELALVFWGICIHLLVLGAGKFSLDAKIFGERR